MSSSINYDDITPHFPDPNGNKIVLSEKIDGGVLRHIIDNIDKYEDKLIKKDSDWTIDRYKNSLTAILRKCKGGKLTVSYKQLNTQGRYFGSGLQTIPKIIRHSISKNYYFDVDIKNAHPTFLSHYCKNKGLEHTYLKQYVKDREGYFTLLKDTHDRENAKSLMLSIINGKVIHNFEKYPDCILHFYNELLLIRNRIMELEPALVKIGKKNLKKKGRTEENLDGTVCNLLMCNWENIVLINMYNFFYSQNIKVDVLVFDGLMVSNDNLTEDTLIHLLVECSDYVKWKTGVEITLTIKPMDEGLDIEQSEDLSYLAVKKEFEINNFKCIDRSCFINIEHNMVREKTKTDMISSYEHLVYVNNDGDDKEFIRVWFKDPDMRKYEFVSCIPPPITCPEHTFNLWDGFQIDKASVDATNCDILLNHIKLLSNNDMDTYEFIMKWLGCLVQKPAFKNNIALLFKTNQGMGKDLFYTMLDKMIGSKYCGNTSRPEFDIFGLHNKFLKDKLLVVMNEFNGGIGHKYSDKLKDLITSLKDPIRKMRTDVEGEISFAKYMFFTNNEFPIKIERGDRRLFVSEVIQPIPPKEYFDKLVDTINNDGALKSLYDTLMKMDISKVDWIKDKPMTDYMSDLLENSTDREMVFIVNKMKQSEEKEIEISSKDLLDEFRDGLLSESSDYRTNSVKFGLKIKKYYIDGFSVKHTKKGNVYVFNTQKCIEWFIKNGYIESNYNSLDDTHVSLINRVKDKEKYENIMPLG